MAEPVSSIRNLGPASDKSFTRAGIKSAEALREMGADAAYAALLKTGTQPHFIGYYALVMGLQGRTWNDCQGDEKVELRKRFDEIETASNMEKNSTLEKELDALGVGTKHFI